MSDGFGNMSMLELFREEMDAHAAALDTGLLALEASPDDRATLDALMRAAHSIKGAAKIVGLDAGVQIAHAMEDVFVSARAGELRIHRAMIDAELACVDLLRQLAACDEPAAKAFKDTRKDDVAAALAGLLAARAAPPPGPLRPVTPKVAEQPTVAPSVQAASAVAAESAASSEPVDNRPAQSADARERVIRVAAESMSRVLNLASEALVASGRLQGAVDGLRETRTRHLGLAEVLDELHDVLRASPLALGLVDEARQRSSELAQAVSERLDELEDETRRSHDLASRLHREVLASRMRPLDEGISKYPRVVRDLGRALGKEVKLEIVGGTVGVDRDILDKLDAPLGHLLRNAVDHGLENPAERVAKGKSEQGTLRIEARHRAGLLAVAISDDGRGIDVEKIRTRISERGFASAANAANLDTRELLEFLFLPGFSTRDAVTELSGRGVGLDVVQSTIREVGGDVRIVSHLGFGTRFELELPLTRSVVRCLHIEVAGAPHAIALHRVERVVRSSREQVSTIEGREQMMVDGHSVGLVTLAEVLELGQGSSREDALDVVVIGDRQDRFGLVVDRIIGELELVLRPLDPRLGRVQDVIAIAMGRDGSPIVVLDVDDLARSCASLARRGRPRLVSVDESRPRARKRVLVVDDSITVREVERQILENRGYEVVVATDGADGWNAVRAGEFDLVITDVDMPRMNGLELTRAIKDHPRLRVLPVMIVSYKERDADRMRGLEAGADYYLGKTSFHDETLARAVEELIGGPS
ncbi:MAG: hybrid sensor histidine kinase/response regulator [Sandaracinaceae bacterium]|nr:hybrid sensor histidine kinase/response regulator [Sandaracinaceae bacterium]